MYLKSLTLTGFKSFGKTTLFEFPTSITAIVGPNGSGKSNVAESIRWVLGEQSMKSLRGKKGEDLIFHGSEKVARLARAEVKLIFDNSAKQLPFEFDDVIISRRVMRDGTNEYLLNGSHVRLKDIFEILSKVGLGITQHHIISQGEVDRILWTSPFERQEMVEDALGLREFHMKAKETLRKLEETGINMKQVEAQRREIQPHLKYLRLQAEKMKAHKKYALDLEEKSQEYLAREGSTLANLKKESHIKREPLMAEEHEYQKKIKALQEEIRHGEKEFSRVPGRDAVRKEIDELEEQRRMLEREFGKIEGLLLAHASSDSDISPTMIAGDIREAILYVDELLGKDSFESLKSGLKDVKVRLESLLRTLTGEKKSERSGELAGKKENILGELRVIELKIQDMKDKREEENIVREDIMVDLREREHEIRNLERELEGVRGRLREIEFSNEQYKSREAEFQKFLQEFGIEKHGSGDLFANDAERATLLRAIDRLRLKLEEAGGIDGSVIKEYDTTLERDEFLGRELGDLEKARKSLETLMRELEETLKERFINGLKKINHEFQEIFKTVFDGGKAALIYVKPKKSEVEGEEIEDKGGIEISLEIPHKRLRSLDMLSGGERALVSIAILFAMSSANPPPFLVLDETDAALDEANSQRYGDLLDVLAKKTQLIVITHNRETMRHAGVLYGVTQGDDAISRILSLKFEEAKELAGVE